LKTHPRTRTARCDRNGGKEINIFRVPGLPRARRYLLHACTHTRCCPTTTTTTPVYRGKERLRLRIRRTSATFRALAFRNESVRVPADAINFQTIGGWQTHGRSAATARLINHARPSREFYAGARVIIIIKRKQWIIHGPGDCAHRRREGERSRAHITSRRGTTPRTRAPSALWRVRFSTGPTVPFAPPFAGTGKILIERVGFVSLSSSFSGSIPIGPTLSVVHTRAYSYFKTWEWVINIKKEAISGSSVWKMHVTFIVGPWSLRRELSSASVSLSDSILGHK